MFLRGQLHISRRYGMNRTNGLVVSLNGSALDEAKCKRRRGASIALVTRTRNQAYGGTERSDSPPTAALSTHHLLTSSPRFSFTGLNDFLAHHVQVTHD
jgi:hypothetical protein